MQSEEFDKKVIEAAAHHHPVYNEKAWLEMNKLLDKHLPEKKNDRRRILFFLLLLLCLGGGVWLIAGKYGKKEPVAATGTAGNNADRSRETNAISSNKENTTDKNIPTESTGSETPAINNTGNGATLNTQTQQTKTPAAIPGTKASTGGNENTIKTNITTTGKPTEKTDLSKTRTPGNDLIASSGGGNKKAKTNRNQQPPANVTVVPVETNESVVKMVATTPDEQANKEAVVIPNKDIAVVTPAKPVTDVAVIKAEDKKPDTVATVKTDIKTEEKDIAANKPAVPEKIKLKSPKKFGVALTLSGGSDISSVGLDRPGKLQPMVGVGISFSYGKSLSISTGFYSGRKIYKATAADYKFPTRPSNYSYLYEIDANCKVVEIPITLTWNFREEKKGNWFFSTGVSSFLMRRETYDYLYKYPSGQVHTYTKVFGNKNQHIFSVINLSGGYKRNISNSLFVSAEQYFKVPMVGVGAGKINLNSMGVLITLGIKPFQSIRKNK